MSPTLSQTPTTQSEKPKKKARGTVFIDEERCKGCAICAEFCPGNVLSMSERFNAKGYHPPEVTDPENCSGCELCGLYCPDFAIYAVKHNNKRDS